MKACLHTKEPQPSLREGLRNTNPPPSLPFYVDVSVVGQRLSAERGVFVEQRAVDHPNISTGVTPEVRKHVKPQRMARTPHTLDSL